MRGRARIMASLVLGSAIALVTLGVGVTPAGAAQHYVEATGSYSWFDSYG